MSEEVAADPEPQNGPNTPEIVGKRQLLQQETEAQVAIESLQSQERSQFAALLQLQKERDQRFFEYLVELRRLEIKYEGIYQPYYQQRAELLQGKPGFWLQALTNNAFTKQYISQRDEPVLQFLTDIRSVDDANCDDYSIVFEFAANPYFSEQTLTKRYRHNADQVLDCAEGCRISWKKGMDVSTEQRRMKIKGKQQVMSVAVESFFHYFKNSSEQSDQDELTRSGTYLYRLGHKEEDEELGVELRDEIVPNALLYYLGVRKRDLKDTEEKEVEEAPTGPEEEEKAPPDRR